MCHLAETNSQVPLAKLRLLVNYKDFSRSFLQNEAFIKKFLLLNGALILYSARDKRVTFETTLICLSKILLNGIKQAYAEKYGQKMLIWNRARSIRAQPTIRE